MKITKLTPWASQDKRDCKGSMESTKTSSKFGLSDFSVPNTTYRSALYQFPYPGLQFSFGFGSAFEVHAYCQASSHYFLSPLIPLEAEDTESGRLQRFPVSIETNYSDLFFIRANDSSPQIKNKKGSMILSFFIALRRTVVAVNIAGAKDTTYIAIGTARRSWPQPYFYSLWEEEGKNLAAAQSDCHAQPA